MVTMLLRTALLLTVTVAATGCIERTERLTLDPDGTMAIHLEFETKSFDELYELDRVPTVEAGWLVVETAERNHEGDEVFRLVADAIYAPGLELPSSYEGPLEADPGVALAFPTTVTFEDRADGVYYHFHREYTARPWAYLERARKMLEDGVAEIGADDLESADDAQRRAFVAVATRHETLKYRTFARAAFQETMPTASQDTWLALREAILDSTQAIDYDGVLRILAGDDDDRREAELRMEAERFEKTVIDAMRRVLVTSGHSADENTFTRAFLWQIQYHDITQDLGDDAFTISVEMPGQVVAHNGDQLRGRTVTWRLSGEAFRDRAVELMVTSAVRE